MPAVAQLGEDIRASRVCGHRQRSADADTDRFAVERMGGGGVDGDARRPERRGVAVDAAHIVVVGEVDADRQAQRPGGQRRQRPRLGHAPGGQDATVQVEAGDGVDHGLRSDVERRRAALGQHRQAGHAAFLDQQRQRVQRRAFQEHRQYRQALGDEDALPADAVALADVAEDGDGRIVRVGDADGRGYGLRSPGPPPPNRRCRCRRRSPGLQLLALHLQLQPAFLGGVLLGLAGRKVLRSACRTGWGPWRRGSGRRGRRRAWRSPRPAPPAWRAASRGRASRGRRVSRPSSPARALGVAGLGLLGLGLADVLHTRARAPRRAGSACRSSRRGTRSSGRRLRRRASSSPCGR